MPPSTAPQLDLSPLSQSVRRFHGWEPLTVEGTWPASLRGTLVRAGPGLMERFGHRLAHAFEADGALSGLRLPGDGQAFGAVRVVESPGYLAEAAAGRPLFGSAAPWWRRFVNGLARRDKATGNTSVMAWQGRTYALMEGSRPVEFDSDSLATGDVTDFGGVLGPTFSAHPHRVASHATTYNFGQVHGPKPAIELYALPDHGLARCLGRVPLAYNTLIHDFAVTPNALVFVISSLRLRLGRALLAPKDMLSLIEWAPQLGAELLVVPLGRIDRPQRTPLAPRFVFHLANAFERDGTIVVDFVQYPDLAVMSALSGNDRRPAVEPPHLRRVVVSQTTAALVADAPLWPELCDFPVVPGPAVGQPTKTLWLLTGDENTHNGLVRLDAETGAVDVWHPGHGVFASEAVFVARNDGENDSNNDRNNDRNNDHGWLITLVFDSTVGRSYWAVLDAGALAQGPLAKAWLDQPLPTTFHGQWLPA